MLAEARPFLTEGEGLLEEGKRILAKREGLLVQSPF
jgi:hypothetical protein